MRLRVVSVCTASVAVYAAGCSLITSYDGFSGGALAVAMDSTVTMPDPGPDTHTTLCSSTIPPNPGGSQAIVNDPNVYFGEVYALRFVAKDAGGACQAIGKNLDNLDTCAAESDGGKIGPACVPYGNDPTNMACDKTGGIDNVASSLLESETAGSMYANTMLATELPADLAAQRTGFVLSLSDYGGELNNPTVDVGFFTDVGTADGGTLLDTGSFSGGKFAMYENPMAYVSNGVLVAHFANVKIPLHFTIIFSSAPGVLASAIIPISDAYIIGVPQIVDGGLSISDGQLVGRIVTADLVSSLTNFYGCLDQKSAIAVCPNLDLAATPELDGTGQPCDAVSIAVGFDMAPTTKAGMQPAIPTNDFCGDAGLAVDTDLCGAAASGN